MKKKTKYTFAFSATDTVMYLLLLFPITTLFQFYIPMLNRIVFFFAYLTMLFALFSKLNTVRLLTLPVLVFLYIWATVHTNFPLINFNDYFYYQFLVIYTLFLVTKRTEIINFFKNNSKYVHGIIYVWCAMIGAAAFIPAFYEERFYFMPYGVNGFRSAPAAVFITCLIVLVMAFYKNRRIFAFTIFPVYMIFTGNSRTYFIVGVMLFVLAFYFYCKGKSKFYLFSIPGALVGYKLYTVTNVAKKTNELIDSNAARDTFWEKISSGRSYFWQIDMEAFYKYDISKKLFGNGFNYVYYVNYYAGRGAMWAHNDFINLLLNFGIVGTVLYLLCIFALIAFILFRGKCRVPIPIVLAVIIIWLFNAMFNMFYTYFCACASFPLLLLAINYYYTEKSETEMMQKKMEAEMHAKALEARRKGV